MSHRTPYRLYPGEKTAAFDGAAFGEAVGLIWDRFGIDCVPGDSCTIRSVHYIGVSVGAFPANAWCLNKNRVHELKCHVTKDEIYFFLILKTVKN